MNDKPVVNNKEYDVESLWISWVLTPEEMQIKYEDSNSVEYVVKSPWDNDSMICGSQNLTMYLHAKDIKLKETQAKLDKAVKYLKLIELSCDGNKNLLVNEALKEIKDA